MLKIRDIGLQPAQAPNLVLHQHFTKSVVCDGRHCYKLITIVNYNLES